MKQPEIEQWLNVTHSAGSIGSYRHTWCRQTEQGQWEKHLPSIVKYLERAHADAREYFHSAIQISLDPVPSQRHQPSYPHDMPLKTKKGYFGEALCGMFTEAMQVAGADNWIVPAFLFRLHGEAEDHLFRLVMKEKTPKDIPGRTGSDFIAIAMGKDGKIEKLLSGEAKCHNVFNVTKCKQFLRKIDEEGAIPVSLPKLKRILKDQDTGDLAHIIAAIEEVLLTERIGSIPKSNLFLYLYDNSGVVANDTARITDDLKASSYLSNAPLHVFEICIPDGTKLVEKAYDQVYRGGK